MASLPETFLPGAGLTDVIAAHALLGRIDAGHVPGLPVSGPTPYVLPATPSAGDLVSAAITAAEGVAGSDSLDDVGALVALTQIVERQRAGTGAVGESRLRALLAGYVDNASPLIQGASIGALTLLGHVDLAATGRRLSSWVDAPVAGDGASTMARRLAGLLASIAALIEASSEILDPVAARVEGIDDGSFLDRLPSLREGFEVLSPAARDRFLVVIGERLDVEDVGDLERSMTVSIDPARLAANADRRCRGPAIRGLARPGTAGRHRPCGERRR